MATRPGALLNIRDIGATVTVLQDNDQAWPYYNPSIAWDESGALRIAIRACNFTVRPEGGWYLTQGDHAKTKVMYGYLDPNTLTITGLAEVLPSKDSPEAIHKCGLEDGRLFLRGKTMHIIGVQVDTTQKHIIPASQAEFSIGKYGDNMEYIRTLKKPDENRVEKNWMPTDKETPAFDFQYSPTQTWKDGIVTGPDYDGNLHGGTQLLQQKDGTWLAIIHDVKHATFVRRPGERRRRKRNYIHYLAEYSTAGQLQRLSRPFIFGTTAVDFEGIEFAAGMVEHKGDLLVSFGIRDAKIGIARIPKAAAIKLLEPYKREDETTIIDGDNLAGDTQAGYPDIVIPVKAGGDHENLRYVLRSIEANWPHGQVWIIGEKPTWARGIRHIPVKSQRTLKYDRIAEVWETIANPRFKISQQFVWFNDDIFVMKRIEDMANRYGPSLKRGNARNYYERSLNTTHNLIAKREDAPADIKDYDLHTPFIAWRKDIDMVRKTTPRSAGLFQYRSMIGNLGRYGGIGSADVKVYEPDEEPTGTEQFISITDKTWKDGAAGRFIRQAFTKKSRYEI